MLQHPLQGYGALFFDADGTLRRCVVPGQPCPNAPGEWELLPGVVETLALYDWSRTGCSIISNQGGVGLGFLSETMARCLLHCCLVLATGTRVYDWQVLMCPHAPMAGCDCRKPKPGLLLRAEMSWYSRAVLHGPRQCVYVGDRPEDQDAALAADIPFIWAWEFFGWSQP